MTGDQICLPHKHQNILPRIWLFTDQRTAQTLLSDIAALPAGSGIVFRHYHLPLAKRKALFMELQRKFRGRGLLFIWSGRSGQARHLGADGVYAAASQFSRQRAIGPQMLRLAAVHNLAEMAIANRLGADLVFLSPVFATRSHVGAKGLGIMRFAAIARCAQMPVCALGGVTPGNYRKVAAFSYGFGAIDGLLNNLGKKFRANSTGK